MRSFHIAACLVVACLLPAGARSANPPPAFPGAEGYGAVAVGGRGGRVLEVTNLNDSGPGSLRAALEASGPRTVVFRVGGTIELESEIRIEHPYVTVAGQTAPGGGILLRAGGGADEPLIRLKDSHDVILRYLRLRIGPRKTSDNLSIRGAHNVVLDHLSLSWSKDENIQFWRDADDPVIQNVTLQRSLVSEALVNDGSDGLGLQIGGDDVGEAWRDVKNLSIHHNLFAHNRHRNPRLTAIDAEAINNVAYNWRTRIGISTRGAVYDYINNFGLVGPMRADTLRDNPDWLRKHLIMHEPRDDAGVEYPVASIYTAGNIVEPGLFTDPDADNGELWTMRNAGSDGAPLDDRYRRHTRLAPPAHPVRIELARDAYASVLADVGANARLSCRGEWVPNADPVDRRVLDEVHNGTGPSEPISSPDQLGGYPALEPGSPCADSDRDGMPDEWETLRGLNPNDASDGPADPDGDGYTNLELYLNGNPEVPASLAPPILLDYLRN